MRYIFGAILLATIMSGCAGVSSIGLSHPRPTATAQVAAALPTPTSAVSLDEQHALQSYACALVPVSFGLHVASSRYSDARNAVAAQLPESAALDMREASNRSQLAGDEISLLAPPSAMVDYHAWLGQAASGMYSAGVALQSDYASSNMTAATRDGKAFRSAASYLARADRERRRIAHQVPLPSESSPRCTSAYLRSYLAERNLTMPHLQSSAPGSRSAAAPSRHHARHKTVRTHRTAPRRVKPPASPTPRPAATARPTAARSTRHTGPGDAARQYVTAAGAIVSQADAAAQYLSAARSAVAKRGKVDPTPALDSAATTLRQATKALSRLRPPSRGYRSIQRELQTAIAVEFTVVREIRLSLIDSMGAGRSQVRADLHAADQSMRRAAQFKRLILANLARSLRSR